MNHSTDCETNHKRRVSRACVMCNAAKTACDEGRPCSRCIRLNVAHQCFSIEPKKRGPKPKRPPAPDALSTAAAAAGVRIDAIPLVPERDRASRPRAAPRRARPRVQRKHPRDRDYSDDADDSDVAGGSATDREEQLASRLPSLTAAIGAERVPDGDDLLHGALRNSYDDPFESNINSYYYDYNTRGGSSGGNSGSEYDMEDVRRLTASALEPIRVVEPDPFPFDISGGSALYDTSVGLPPLGWDDAVLPASVLGVPGGQAIIGAGPAAGGEVGGGVASDGTSVAGQSPYDGVPSASRALDSPLASLFTPPTVPMACGSDVEAHASGASPSSGQDDPDDAMLLSVPSFLGAAKQVPQWDGPLLDAGPDRATDSPFPLPYLPAEHTVPDPVPLPAGTQLVPFPGRGWSGSLPPDDPPPLHRHLTPAHVPLLPLLQTASDVMVAARAAMGHHPGGALGSEAAAMMGMAPVVLQGYAAVVAALVRLQAAVRTGRAAVREGVARFLALQAVNMGHCLGLPPSLVEQARQQLDTRPSHVNPELLEAWFESQRRALDASPDATAVVLMLPGHRRYFYNQALRRLWELPSAPPAPAQDAPTAPVATASAAASAVPAAATTATAAEGGPVDATRWCPCPMSGGHADGENSTGGGSNGHLMMQMMQRFNQQDFSQSFVNKLLALATGQSLSSSVVRFLNSQGREVRLQLLTETLADETGFPLGCVHRVLQVPEVAC